MSTFNGYEEKVAELRPDLNQEDIEEFLQWLKINYDETETLTSAVNRYYPVYLHGECGA
jgi:hypothetical protein